MEGLGLSIGRDFERLALTQTAEQSREAACLLRVAHPAMSCAAGSTFGRVTTVGTASNHRLTDLAARFLDLAASLADFLSGRSLGLYRLCFHLARFIANRFLCCLRGRHEC